MISFHLLAILVAVVLLQGIQDIHAKECRAGLKWYAPAKMCYDPKPIWTTMGNGNDADCAIPFKYKGKWRRTCLRGKRRPWCGITHDYDKVGRWGYCTAVSCQTQDKKAVPEGRNWTYKGITYICRKDGKGKIIHNIHAKKDERCFTTIGKYYAPADLCYDPEPIWTLPLGGNGGGADCAIPWKYKGEWLTTCLEGKIRHWCAVTHDYDKDGLWGYCTVVSCQTHDKKTVHEGQAWTYGGYTYICQKDGTGKKNCSVGEAWYAPGNKCYDPKPIWTIGGNAGGADCAIPFKYKGEWQARCVPGKIRPWCGVSRDYDKDGLWGYCTVVTCLTDKGEKVHEGRAWTSGGITYICQKDGKGKKSNCKFPFTHKNVVYKDKCAGTYGLWCYIDKDQKKIEYC